MLPFLDNVVIFTQHDSEKDGMFNRVLTDVLGDVESKKNPFENKMISQSPPFFGDFIMCGVQDGHITTLSEKQLRKYMMLNGLPQGIANINGGHTVFTHKPFVDKSDDPQ